MTKVIIIGGVAGGASAAARLRRLDETAEIIMFERGEYISFANCGLPYYVGGAIKDKQNLTLQTPESFNKRFNVDVRVFSEVVSIDKARKTVGVKDIRTGRTYEESYDKLILSPGAEPTKPPIKGLDNKKVFSIRNIPDTYRVKDFIDSASPRKVVVVGGGYIGIEMAENLYEAGIEVTIVEFANHVIATLDYDLACDVHNHIRQKGVELILNDGVKEITDEGDRLKIVLGEGELIADMVVMAVGVVPEGKLAKEAGLAVNKRGAVIVNDKMLTSDENIYAVGDVTEVLDFCTGQRFVVPLAGPANKQGRIAADNICGINSIYEGTQGTGILKAFDLTVAMTGITENRARALNLPYMKSYTYSVSHASYYPGALNMSIKILFEPKEGKLLGAQIVGYDGVDKRIDVLATAIRAGMTVYDLTKLELAYAPPYSSAKDPVNMAGFVAENILTGKVKVIHWDELDALPRGEVTLLDVRTSEEFENGQIEDFINIPLDELRQNLDKLDKNKKLYVTCQTGLRSYIAVRILQANGYDCYNLSGGYRLYQSIKKGDTIKMTNTTMNSETMRPIKNAITASIKLDACGLQCPGPIMKLSAAVKSANDGDTIEIITTDPAFGADVEAWCRRTGNTFVGITSEKGVTTATIIKGGTSQCARVSGDGKNIIVFSGDLDKAIASFIIANGAAAMGRKVSMFFTFWGLNILRKSERVSVKKDFMSRMFGKMMPRGSKKLGLSRMNMGGMGGKLIRYIMKKKNVNSLEDLVKSAMESGVEIVACTMSMDIMGIKMEELIDGVKAGGVAAM
ncbi:MAG: FAD-dependent oxidoreductase [Clostridia bacterium]|nr:FAD-dependent oxidoreductase [Clostridia bacterium]